MLTRQQQSGATTWLVASSILLHARNAGAQCRTFRRRWKGRDGRAMEMDEGGELGERDIDCRVSSPADAPNFW